MPLESAWSPALSVGHAVLDAQHERLLLLCSRLFGTASSMNKGDFLALLNDLAALVHEHFETEEHILREFGYPQFKAHQAEHDVLRGRLTDLLYEAIYDRFDTADLPELARDLVLNHVRDCDLAFKGFLAAASS